MFFLQPRLWIKSFSIGKDRVSSFDTKLKSLRRMFDALVVNIEGSAQQGLRVLYGPLILLLKNRYTETYTNIYRPCPATNEHLL